MTINFSICNQPGIEHFDITIQGMKLTQAIPARKPGKIWLSNESGEGMYIPENIISDFLRNWLKENI